jgi:hypothetical protein
MCSKEDVAIVKEMVNKEKDRKKENKEKRKLFLESFKHT